MSSPVSKLMSAKVSASIQSGDSTSLLQIALFIGVAVLAVLLLIFLYKKFVAKKAENEYFEGMMMEEPPAPTSTSTNTATDDDEYAGPQTTQTA